MENSLSPTVLNAIYPGDPQYDFWNNRGVNLQFAGKPSRIIPVTSDEELISAMQETFDQKQRLAIRSGGHCLEDFVSNPDVDVILDVSQLKGIRFDPMMNAIEIKAGNTLGEVYQTLVKEWGIVLPAGEHPAIGIGGHISGGAFGFLCRQHGLGADYLYAVEVVYISKVGKAEKIIATREMEDVNRELWWAHTGGGAGNFGAVTRYWFRAQNVTSNDPSRMLPTAPASVETFEIDWAWQHLDSAAFSQLVINYGSWCTKNAQYDTAGSALYSTLHLWNKQRGKIQLKGLLTERGPGTIALSELLRALNQNIPFIPFQLQRKTMSWLEFALNPFPDVFSGAKAAFKVKDAFLLKPFTPEQIQVAYSYLTEWDTPGGAIGLATYGGRINDLTRDVTASVQRKAIMGTACVAGWLEESDKEKYLEWIRKCYSDLYKRTGGVPVPGDQTGGCIIAHPDKDMADPTWNKSGVPWYVFYYQDNYPRLQKVKAKWDPLNVFRHSLGVQGG